MIDKTSFFWQYLSPGQRGLIKEGFFLLEDAKQHPNEKLSDYSYLVFPFAKAFEGFLKKLFLDMNFITKDQYESKHFRIGKALNPALEHHLGDKSVYRKIKNYCGDDGLSDELWTAWKKGRNQLFHYFVHNLKAVSLEEAEYLIAYIISAMQKSVKDCHIPLS